MANCKFCGEPAGFLRKKHAECHEKYVAAIELVKNAASGVATGVLENTNLTTALANAKSSYVPVAHTRAALINGWESAVDHFLEDGVLDHKEEESLVSFKAKWSLDQSDLDRRGAFTRLVKAGVLRDVMEGKVPERVTIESGTLPFNFQKNEELVWLFQNVEYLEDKTRREYAGRSAGVSIRIAKGVYYRTAAFRGHPIERTERVSLGRGLLAITTKHVYFDGAKSFRVKHEKIVSHTPFSDGVAIVRDSASAKPQVFVTGDGWFTYNLLSNIGQL